MTPVADTSFLVALHHLDLFDLAQSVFGSINIPPAVHAEFTVRSKPGSERLQDLPWIRVAPLANAEVAERLKSELDDGEAEVIALALQLGSRLVLMDDPKGRRYAGSAGLDLMGSVGFLILAKQRGLIPTIRPLLEALRSHGFRLSSYILEDALKRAGE